MIDTIANNVAQRLKNKNRELPKEQQVLIDPASVLLIVNMVEGIINLIKKCREKRNQTDEQTVSYVNKPTLAQRWAVRNVVRKELGFFRNIIHGRQFREALLAEGGSLTKDEIIQSIQEKENKA